MQLTVIMRDDSPMWHANDCPKYRTVRITLTAEQCEAITPKAVGYKGDGSTFYEEISMCILEESK